MGHLQGLELVSKPVVCSVRWASVSLHEPAHNDHDAGKLNETYKVVNLMFHPADEALEVLEPAVGSFDAISSLVASELPTVLGGGFLPTATMRTNQIDATLLQPFTQRIAVGGPVVDEMLGSSLHFLMVDQVFDQRDFGGAGTVDLCRQRKSVAVGKDHDLASLAAFRVAHARAPFFARANVPSASASFQSISPRSSSTSSRVDQISANSPDRLHSCSRRQHVDGDGKFFGKSCHRAPLRSSQRIPSRHARGEHGGRPPSGLGIYSGKNPAIKFHCSSESCVFGSVLDAVAPQTGQVRGDSVAFMIVPPFRGMQYATPLPTRSLMQGF